MSVRRVGVGGVAAEIAPAAKLSVILHGVQGRELLERNQKPNLVYKFKTCIQCIIYTL